MKSKDLDFFTYGIKAWIILWVDAKIILIAKE